MEVMYKLYCLRCPKTQQLRYIGQTKETLEERLRGHVKAAPKFTNHRCNWIKSLIREGLKPTIHLLYTTTEESYINFLENRAIVGLLNRGVPLVNTDKGVGIRRGYSHSPETREKISAKAKTQDLSVQVQAMKKANTGRVRSEKERAQISLRQTGRKLTPEAKAKIAAHFMGKALPRYAVEANILANTKWIIQKDLQGNVIQEFYGYRPLNEFFGRKGRGNYEVTKAINKGTTYRGFLWEHKNTNQELCLN